MPDPEPFTLRMPRREDLAAVWAIHSDAETNRHNPAGPLRDRSQARALHAAHRERPQVAVIAHVAPGHVASRRTALRAGLAVVGEDRHGRTVLADRPLTADVLRALP